MIRTRADSAAAAAIGEITGSGKAIWTENYMKRSVVSMVAGAGVEPAFPAYETEVVTTRPPRYYQRCLHAQYLAVVLSFAVSQLWRARKLARRFGFLCFVKSL